MLLRHESMPQEHAATQARPRPAASPGEGACPQVGAPALDQQVRQRARARRVQQPGDGAVGGQEQARVPGQRRPLRGAAEVLDAAQLAGARAAVRPLARQRPLPGVKAPVGGGGGGCVAVALRCVVLKRQLLRWRVEAVPMVEAPAPKREAAPMVEAAATSIALRRPGGVAQCCRAYTWRGCEPYCRYTRTERGATLRSRGPPGTSKAGTPAPRSRQSAPRPPPPPPPAPAPPCAASPPKSWAPPPPTPRWFFLSRARAPGGARARALLFVQRAARVARACAPRAGVSRRRRRLPRFSE